MYASRYAVLQDQESDARTLSGLAGKSESMRTSLSASAFRNGQSAFLRRPGNGYNPQQDERILSRSAGFV